jgi:hypothetical protein
MVDREGGPGIWVVDRDCRGAIRPLFFAIVRRVH